MRLLAIIFLVFALFSCDPPSNRPIKILVFTKTAGFAHSSIPDGVKAIQNLAKAENWNVVVTNESESFNEQFLKDCSAIVFLNTTGDVLNGDQEIAMERFVQAGGGFVGIHAASDTEYQWPWYGKLVGAYFDNHPQIQDAKINVQNSKHPATKHLPSPWIRKDEWYNFKKAPDHVEVLLELDESSYEGGNMGGNHPFSWAHEYDGGRAFYTAGGHTKESYQEEAFLQHLKGGIEYAIGKNQLNYAFAKSEYPPEENRFVKTTLLDNLNEPMELAITADGMVLLVERKGRVRSYDPSSGHVATVAMIDVHTGEEDGLMGIAVDPNYEENQWVYMYYAPAAGHDRNVLARFIFDGETINLDSKIEILEVPTNRPTCCHSGGSLAFGPDGSLYISTGDNTNPFESDGFSPSDERKDRAYFDAQRSAANTNDLRGKVLRILPQADGSYTIPEGNLFAPGTPNTRPEIFVMGCRNPFRISIDQKKGWLYWGDVGPDSGVTKEERGPKGYDEINQAKTAGFYGWPYFRGNLTPYRDFNFEAKVSGPHFDVNHPTNDSPNNTGLQQLPDPTAALIWYSYDESIEFPWTGIGGKNPMAGPIYYSDQYQGKYKFPEYFDNKLIIYEWMRHWIYIIEMDSTGAYQRAVPFMENTTFSRPMDMAFAPDGTLYTLEYGNRWFAKNPEAQLARIKYVRGNRPPSAKIEASAYSGSAPLQVRFDAQSSTDPDNDALKYEWKVNGKDLGTSASASHTFNFPGVYEVSLSVTDEQGLSELTQTSIQVGNAPPEVAITIEGNTSFYWEDTPLRYIVDVNDKEDGQLYEGIKAERVQFQIEPIYGQDLMQAQMGHQTADNLSGLARGEQLISASDCKNCHAIHKQINGPSYMDIAQRYKDDSQTVKILANKVIQGGGGNWGEKAMAAHPQLTEKEAEAMITYILSVNDAPTAIEGLPLDGIYWAKTDPQKKRKPQYVLSARFTDSGNGPIESISSSAQHILLYPQVEVDRSANLPEKARKENREDGRFVLLEEGQEMKLGAVDATMVQELKIRLWSETSAKLSLEWGEMQKEIAVESNDVIQELSLAIDPMEGKMPLTIKVQDAASSVWFDWIRFEKQNSSLLSQNIK